ncbi:MAG: hypothetical protein BGO43_09765 [Gammaproteobacteria bacterium 39-13]|nr:MAG: hypothetical protein BGO43_09765 [Gammaproteobacteria bacterium 39-13]
MDLCREHTIFLDLQLKGTYKFYTRSALKHSSFFSSVLANIHSAASSPKATAQDQSISISTFSPLEGHPYD